MRGLQGKVAVVTGSASGIGAATARRLAEEGVRLLLGDKNAEQGAAVAKEIDPSGEAVAFQACDVTEQSQVDALMQAACDRFDRLDIAFNNAGIGAWSPTPDLPPEVWHQVVAVNLNAVYYGCHAAIPLLRASGGGAIINTASISGLFGDYGLGVYNATKGAVVNYTRSLAGDHAREGIRVNAVCPGPIDTALLEQVKQLPGIQEEYAAKIPMGRLGQAEEIASAVTFLASDDASYVTGVNFVVDGGLTAMTGQPSFTQAIARLQSATS